MSGIHPWTPTELKLSALQIPKRGIWKTPSKPMRNMEKIRILQKHVLPLCTWSFMPKLKFQLKLGSTTFCRYKFAMTVKVIFRKKNPLEILVLFKLWLSWKKEWLAGFPKDYQTYINLSFLIGIYNSRIGHPRLQDRRRRQQKAWQCQHIGVQERHLVRFIHTSKVSGNCSINHTMNAYV